MEPVEVCQRDPKKVVAIGRGLDPYLRNGVIALLREYSDVFAWRPEDMLGLRENVVVHRLHLDPMKPSVKQKRRNFTLERHQTIDEEFGKLLKADFIYEIQFSEQVSNFILVKKSPKNGGYVLTIQI